MRLIKPIRGLNVHRRFKDLWANRRSIKKITDAGIPQFLTERNIPVYDAVKFAKERDPVDLNKFFPSKVEKRQTEWGYLVNQKTHLLEGPLQAQILTNCLARTSLPKEYEEAFKAMPLGDDEIEWFQNRLQLNALDSKQFKLPLRIDPERVWHRFTREYGPGISRQTHTLLETFNDFVRLHSNKPHSIHKPLIHELSCQYFAPPTSRNAYIFQSYSPSVAISQKPLSVLSSSDSSKENSGPIGEMPSIYPTLPEVDLVKTFEYEPATIFPLNVSNEKGVPHPESSFCLHTLFVSHPWNNDEWKLSHKLARAILQTFTFAAAQTVSQFGKTNEDLRLPERFRLQTIYHDLEHVGFIVFHLNTLRSASEGQIRNELHHECVPLQKDGRINARALKWLKVFYES